LVLAPEVALEVVVQVALEVVVQVLQEVILIPDTVPWVLGAMEALYHQQQAFDALQASLDVPEVILIPDTVPTFRSWENGFLDRNACSFCLFCEMVILAKKRYARRSGRKNRCCSKVSLQHARHTGASPVDRFWR